MGRGDRKRERETDGGSDGLLLLLPTTKGQARLQKVTSACSCARDLLLYTTAGLRVSPSQMALVWINRPGLVRRL